MTGRGGNGHAQALASLAILIAVAGNVAVYIASDKQTDRADKAAEALCAQRDDLDAEIVSTRRLLKEDSQGDIFGIPRDLILEGLERNETTRANLDIIDC
jgi:hypothetical protein